MSGSEDDKTIVLGGEAGGSRSIPPATPGGNPNCLPINTRLGEFEILSLVGAGGFGIVYLAYDHSLERKVALKEYMPASLASRTQDLHVSVRSERHRETFEVGLRSFVNEARLLARFDNPALVKVYRFWEEKGSAYMAMPFYDGVTLRDALKQRTGAPDEGWIRRILVPLMDALELMHSESCFHRDIAPDNILLLKDERPVLLDFGAARRVIVDMTQVLTVILKPGFAPIEQYAETPGLKQGAWTDIYALAAVVYYIITGRTPPASVGRLMNDTYQPLARLAEGSYDSTFLAGLDQCLAIKSDDRPQSIAAMREILGFSTAPAALFPLESTLAMPAGPVLRDSAPQVKSTLTIAGLQFTMKVSPTQQRPQGPAVGDAPLVTQEKGGRKLMVPALGIAALTALVAVGYIALKGSEDAPKPAILPEATKMKEVPAGPAPVTQVATETVQPAALAPVSWSQAVQALSNLDSREITISGIKSKLMVGKDALSFALKSEQAGYVYLLLLDKTSGKLSLIFPNAEDLDNRIAAGALIRFPRANWSFTADTPAGEWEVLVIVADNKRDFSGLGMVAHDGIASVPLQALEQALTRLGSGSLAGLPVCQKEGASCATDFGVAHFKVTEVENSQNMR